MSGLALVYDEHRVRRDGDLDLAFVGALLGTGRHRALDGRWTEVDIFLTRSGKFVAATRFGSENRPDAKHIAAACDTYDDLMEWLRGPRNLLGYAAKEALDRAAGRYPEVFPHRPVVRID